MYCRAIPKAVSDEMTRDEKWNLVSKKPKEMPDLFLTVVKARNDRWYAVLKDGHGNVIYVLNLDGSVVSFRGGRRC